MNRYDEATARFREGLEELLFVNPTLGALARSMGKPRWDETKPTAYVTFEPGSKTILFGFNPEFITTLSVDMCAAVLLHETYHVALEHLPEALSGLYPDQQALVKAQECIINDTISTVHSLPLPDFVMRGPDLCGQDCTPMSTRMAYELFAQASEQPQQDQDCPVHGGKGDESDQAEDSGDSEKQEEQESPNGTAQDGNETDSDSSKQEDASETEDGQESPDDAEGADAAGEGSDSNGEDQEASEGSSEDGADGGQDGNEGEAGDGQGEQGDSDGEGDPTADHSHGDSGPQCTCPDGANQEPCGGVLIPEGMSAQDVAEAIGKIFQQAAADEGVSVTDIMEAVSNSSGGGYSPTGAPVSEEAAYSAERMNWRLLLAKINPKVLEAGKRAKVRYNWTRTNRRMTSVYPRVILPKVELEEPKPKDRGDSLPVLVVALDLSGSIDRSLVGTLQGLLNEIPEELIKAYPATWGSTLIPYTEGGRVAGGGTDIHNVVRYVERVQQETGTDPYVLVITDGQFTHRFERPGKDWFFMAVDRASIGGIVNYGHVKDRDDVYLVDDFKI